MERGSNFITGKKREGRAGFGARKRHYPTYALSRRLQLLPESGLAGKSSGRAAGPKALGVRLDVWPRFKSRCVPVLSLCLPGPSCEGRDLNHEVPGNRGPNRHCRAEVQVSRQKGLREAFQPPRHQRGRQKNWTLRSERSTRKLISGVVTLCLSD